MIGGVIFQNEMRKRAAVLSGLPANIAAELQSGSAGASTATVQGLPDSQKGPVLEAYAQSLSMMWIFFTFTALGSLISSFFITKSVLSKTHEDVKTGIEGQEEGRRQRAEASRRSKQLTGEGGEKV